MQDSGKTTPNEVNKNYVTVLTDDQLPQLLTELSNAKVVGFDIETTGLNPRKDAVIGISVSTEIGNGWYVVISYWDSGTNKLVEVEGGRRRAEQVVRLLSSKDKLVMHNGSFDIRFCKHFFSVDLTPNLWADTIMMIHTVREEGPFGLKDNAILIQSEIGLDIEQAANQEQIEVKNSVKANGGSVTKTNFELYKADLPIIAKYACADTDLTLRLCKYYYEMLKQQNLIKFFFDDEVMPIYKELTIPMESHGIMLDLQLLHDTDKQIQQHLQHYRDLIISNLTALTPFREWVLDSAANSIKVSNKGKFANALVKHVYPDLQLESLNAKSRQQLPDGPVKQFLTTGDPALLPSDVTARILIELWRTLNDGELVNINSTNQLGQIVFDYLGESPISTTNKGAPQFNDELIEHLQGKYPWIYNLHIYNKLTKIKSSYIDRFLSEHEDGIFYPYFKQFGTVSGRYSSNLQQLPKPLEPDEDDPIVVHYVNLIRAFFISRPGKVFIDCDYESLEPHIFASVSGDENLQQIFEKGHDFYSTVAIRTENLSGVSADKKAPNYLKNLNPVKRQQAKSYSLGMAYGMSPYALAMTLDIPVKAAGELHKGYLKGFPGVAKWIQTSRAFTKQHGFIINKVGRIRHLPQVKAVYDSIGDAILDYKYRQQLNKQLSSKEVQDIYSSYRNGLNNCLNFQIQSMAASIVNRAAVQINRYLTEYNIPGLVVAQIHDQLVVEVDHQYAEQVKPVVQHFMESTTKMEGITFKAPPAIATNMKDGH